MSEPVAPTRRAAGLAVALAAVLAGIFVSGARVAAQTEQVVLGLLALAPLTGNYATGGWSIANALELAVNEASASGRYRVRFVLQKEDTRGDQMQALNAMNKLIAFDRVTAIVGPVLSGETLTAGPIAQDAAVPFITPAATALEVSEIGDYQFRNVVTNDVQAARMVQYAVEELGVSSLAIMYSNSDYGVGLRRAVEEAAPNAGARVVAAESYLDGDSNFSAQLTSIAGRKPDALYIAGYYTEAAMIFCPGAIRARRAAAPPA